MWDFRSELFHQIIQEDEAYDTIGVSKYGTSGAGVTGALFITYL